MNYLLLIISVLDKRNLLKFKSVDNLTFCIHMIYISPGHVRQIVFYPFFRIVFYPFFQIVQKKYKKSKKGQNSIQKEDRKLSENKKIENYPKKGIETRYPENRIENYPKKRIENYPSHMARANISLVQRIFEQRGLFQAQKTALFKAPLYPKKGIENYPKKRIENYPSHMAKAIDSTYISYNPLEYCK